MADVSNIKLVTVTFVNLYASWCIFKDLFATGNGDVGRFYTTDV